MSGSILIRLRKLLPLLVLVVLAVLAIQRFGDSLTFEALQENRQELLAWRDGNYVLAAISYVLAYSAVVAFSIPGATFMTLAGGFLFGLVAGTLMTVLAATLGATAIFLIACAGLGEALHARLTQGDGAQFFARISAGLRENEISYLFMMRLIPAIPFFVANLAPAFLGVGLRNYVITTFLGIMPATAVITWVGSGLGEVFARGEKPDLSILFQPFVMGPILALCLLAALPILLKKLRKEPKA